MIRKELIILPLICLVLLGIIIFIIIRLLMKKNTALGKWLSITIRPPLRSDNLNDTLRLNRFLANPIFIILLIAVTNIGLLLLYTFAINIFREIPAMIKDPNHLENYINRYQLLPKWDEYGVFIKSTYPIFFIFLMLISVGKAYKTRLSYSEKAINKGNSGTSRWTTLKEIVQQYKEIDMYPSHHGATNFFKGKGGMPIARWRDKFYIDSQLTNNLFLGATRSGKGEMFVFPMIDIFSRAENQALRPSMIIFDPKLELYKSAFKTLRDRGYEVRLLNLDNPMKSAGYNPLSIIIDYYKRGKTDEAQLLARSFAFGIFNNNNPTQDPIWPTTATDLWTAMIMAVVSDCLENDDKLNTKRGERFNRLRQTFDEYITSDEATEEGIELRREMFAKVYLKLEEGEDFLDADLCSEYNEFGIPDYIPDYVVRRILGEDNKEKTERVDISYNEIYPNEKNINCFSVLNFFKLLVDTSSVTLGEEVAGAKKAETALDDYFNKRVEENPLDFPAALYSEIKSAGDRTKGSVYITMQSSLSIFMLDNIARLTAESDIDIASIGFDKEKPTAIFIGIPTEDKSNHFLALTFVTQVFQYLWKLSKEGTNKLDREVQFILDEFGNMPVFDNFDGMVTNCLGAGMAFNIFIQSYNQLHSKYELDMDTIKDNFANQFYILAVGQESANEFSEQLGNKNVVEVQRSGAAFSTEKSLLENNKDRPLLFPHELQRLREGETALLRAAKRTDKAGAGIESFPIFDEYQDNIYFWTYIRVFFAKIIGKRLLRMNRMKDRDTGETLSFFQEYRYWISYEKRYQGTAFLYRWQYATDAFPNPTEINFNEIFKEKGRESIDYTERVINIDDVKEELGIQVERKLSGSSIRRVSELNEGIRAKYMRYCYANIGVDFHERLMLSQDMTVKEVSDKITAYVNSLPEIEKTRLQSEDFIGNLNSILLR